MIGITNGLDVDKNGRVHIPVEENSVTRIVQKIAFGLYLHHYQRSRIPRVNQFRVWSIAHAGSSQNSMVVMAHDERFQPRRWIKLQKGVFEYVFVRNWVWTDFGKLLCVMKFHETIWAAVFCPEPRGARGSKRRLSVGEKQFRLFASCESCGYARTNPAAQMTIRSNIVENLGSNLLDISAHAASGFHVCTVLL